MEGSPDLRHGVGVTVLLNSNGDCLKVLARRAHRDYNSLKGDPNYTGNLEPILWPIWGQVFSKSTGWGVDLLNSSVGGRCCNLAATNKRWIQGLGFGGGFFDFCGDYMANIWG